MDQALLDRVRARTVDADCGYSTYCWISTRSRQPNGYTKIGINGRTMLTHRVALIAAHGPIDDGLVVDHLCKQRACANPDHLEAVTMRENLVRGDTITADQIKRTHCPAGHEYSVANTYLRPDRLGRLCRVCRSRASARSRARKAELTHSS